MALIRCYECSAEISDKAKFCPKCGAPAKLHKWRCSKCGNMISEEPCCYCADKKVITNTTSVQQSKNSSQITKQKNIISKIIGLLSFLIILAIIPIIIFTSNSRNNTDSINIPDPNRTEESCSFYGTTKVYGTAHQMSVHCIPDSDGWYNPAFGHHHHK